MAMDALHSAWRRFPEAPPAAGEVRRIILDSWVRSQEAGVPRDRLPSRHGPGRLTPDTELPAVGTPHLEWTSDAMADVPHVICLVDPEGIVLESLTNHAQMRERFGLVPGQDWSERAVGTNAVGTALALQQPVAVVACEHWNHPLHDLVTHAAVVRTADEGVAGAVLLATTLDDETSARLALACHSAYAIEQGLAHFEVERQRGRVTALLADRDRLLEAAEEISRRKDDALGVLSHGLRMSLTAILGWVRLLRSGVLDQAWTASALEIIEHNARLQATLTEDLLHLSRIVAGPARPAT
jgi:transcriptional regulator of acetoin/glycerol metabolism